VPPTKNVDEMFDFFTANNSRAAIVLNEFGGVDGLITMRDIIKFIFGEISESVSSQAYYQEKDENEYEVPGDMKLTDFNDLTNFGIEDPRMTTIGGVVFRYLDRLPKVGDSVVIEGCLATVLEMEGHRLAHVRVTKQAVTRNEEPDETPADGTLLVGEEPAVTAGNKVLPLAAVQEQTEAVAPPQPGIGLPPNDGNDTDAATNDGAAPTRRMGIT